MRNCRIASSLSVSLSTGWKPILLQSCYRVMNTHFFGAVYNGAVSQIRSEGETRG